MKSGEGSDMSMSQKKKRRFSHRGRFRKRALAVAVATAVIGTTVSAAQSLVMPMLIDGTIEDQAAAIFTYQNQVSASLAQTIGDRKSTRLNSSHSCATRMPSSA